MRSGRHVMKIAIPLLLLLLIAMPGCKKKSGSIIEGNWTVRVTFAGNDPSDLFLKFEGDDESGSVYNQKGTILGSLQPYPTDAEIHHPDLLQRVFQGTWFICSPAR